MAERAGGDAALLLDMLLAARDARGFAKDLDEAAFMASRLHQNVVIRLLDVIGEAAGKWIDRGSTTGPGTGASRQTAIGYQAEFLISARPGEWRW